MYVHLQQRRAPLSCTPFFETPPCATPLPPLVLLPLPPSVPTPPAPQLRARALVPHGVGRLRGHRAVRRHARPQPEQLPQGAQPARWSARCSTASGVPLETSVNGYLVNTGQARADRHRRRQPLSDLRSAACSRQPQGQRLSSPEQVDEIYITHLQSVITSAAPRRGQARSSQRRAARGPARCDFCQRSRDGQGAGLGQRASSGAPWFPLKPYRRPAAEALRRQQGTASSRARRRGLPTYGHTPEATGSVYGPKRRAEDGVLGDLMLLRCSSRPQHHHRFRQRP